MPLSLSVASYNVLANAYVPYVRYRRTPQIILDPAWRIPALVQYVANLGTDVLCLQEIELESLAALKSRLGSIGYAAQYARKKGGKPDGCATFYRQQSFELVTAQVVEYADAAQTAANSGHIALILLLRVAGRVFGLANTHLSWDSPGAPSTATVGYRQILQLLDACRAMTPACNGWLICGDLNATPDSEIILTLKDAGFQYAHDGLTQTYTCKVNSDVKMIDYLFHSVEFRAEPQRVVDITDKTVLPSSEQPSDHLPVIARFFWNS